MDPRDLYEKHGGDMDAIAEELKLKPEEMDDIDVDETFEPIYIPEPRRRPADLGRASLRPFKISTRHVFEAGWPAADRAIIEKHRKLYDDGFVEMFQQREGGWFILYSVRRKKRAKPRNWFSSERLV